MDKKKELEYVKSIMGMCACLDAALNKEVSSEEEFDYYSCYSPMRKWISDTFTDISAEEEDIISNWYLEAKIDFDKIMDLKKENK